jgi:hypothetical protein
VHFDIRTIDQLGYFLILSDEFFSVVLLRSLHIATLLKESLKSLLATFIASDNSDFIVMHVCKEDLPEAYM